MADVESVDRTLYEKEHVITSDSVILDHCISWFNLTGECLAGLDVVLYKVWK